MEINNKFVTKKTRRDLIMISSQKFEMFEI